MNNVSKLVLLSLQSSNKFLPICLRLCFIDFASCYHQAFNQLHLQTPLQITWSHNREKKMDLSSERFITPLSVLSIAFPLFFIVTLTYRSQNFLLFEGFSEVRANGGTAQNVTIPALEEASNVTIQCFQETAHNIVAPQLRCEVGQNVTTKAPEGRAQNATKLAAGSRNESVSPTSIPGDDKLPKGLLAPGFDEQSCLSRYQSYLYRKTSPLQPSPYLTSKLRNYENLHRKCGLHTESYNTTISKLIKSTNVTGTTLCKNLVWTAANGLGNRMISMVASFLYAVLTNRVFLVEFERDMVGLFCEPFLNSTWLLSEDFSRVIHHRHMQTYESMLKYDKGKPPPSFLDLNLQHGRHDHERFFHCGHSQDLLLKVPMLVLRSDQYFVPSLFMVSSFKQELGKMFPEKDSVFLHLGQYLFHPSNKVWGLITKFYESHLANADQKIGLQVRVSKVNNTPHQAVMDGILACTLRNKLLPELKKQRSVTSEMKNQTLKVILVASLHSVYSEKLKTMYVSKPTVTGEIIEVFQPSHEEHQKFHNNMHNMKALVEMYLLSLCDVLVTSSKSTLGYVAQGLGGLKPWILRKAKPNGVKNSPCGKAISMEPCFHYPPWHSCLPYTVLNVTSVSPHIRHREDFSWGMKLVQ